METGREKGEKYLLMTNSPKPMESAIVVLKLVIPVT